MIEFDKKELQHALKTVLLAAEQKNTIPILECCQIVANDDGITIRATNLDFDVTTRVAGIASGDQEIIVKAASLNLISQGQGERVMVDDDGHFIRLVCGKMKLRADRHLPDNYPQIPGEQLESAGKINGLVLADLLATVVAASNEESRYALHNVRLTKRDDKIEAAATNSYVLATAAVKDQRLEDFSLLVPALAIQKLRPALADHDYKLDTCDRLFRLTDTESGGVFIVRCGAGSFPDPQLILNSVKRPQFHANIEPLQEAAKLGVQFFASRKNGNLIRIDSQAKKITAISDANELEIESDEIGLLECGKKGFDPTYIGKIFQWQDGEIKAAVEGQFLLARSVTERGVDCQTLINEMRLKDE